MVTIGALLAYCLGWPYAKEHASYISIGRLDLAWWRIMLGMGLVPAVIQVRPADLLCSSCHLIRVTGLIKPQQVAASWEQKLLMRNDLCNVHLPGYG